MIIFFVCWNIFLCLALGPAAKARVTVDDDGYQNVLISFAPNVPDEDGKEIVEEIRDLLESTSKVLHKAIGIPIGSATFLLPPSWPTETWKDITVTPATSQQAKRRPDIKLDGSEDSPFVTQPVALQYGGCGVPGYQIILNLNFIGVFPKYAEGKLLAREWLKYRYGVFEENGFKNDPLYPAYYKIPGKPEIKITECTNSKVKYIFKQPGLGDECDVNTPGFFGYCKTYPDGESVANVTSSLMYFHEDLPNVEHICGKDGRPHNSLARSKQNALCDGRSIWDVIRSSDDFKKTQRRSVNAVPKPIRFSYIQENKSNFAVLLENSNNHFDQDDVTVRPGSAKQQPNLTQVQLTAQKARNFDIDIWIHDATKEQLPILYAKIYFDEYPVKYANVTADVTSSIGKETVNMLDNGRGDPDITQYDGIYSGYFPGSLEVGNYQITVQTNDNERQAKTGKDSSSSVPDACCGSKMISQDGDVPVFRMKKLTTYSAKNSRPKDGYQPSKILDLQAKIFKSSDKLILTWTAPGGGKAAKYFIKLFGNRNDAFSKFDTTGRELNATRKVPKDNGKVEGFVIPFNDLDEDLTYYAAIRSQNEYNKLSEISNVAEFVPKQEKETTPTPTTIAESTTDGVIKNPDQNKDSNKTIGIVLGVLGGIAVLCVLAYLGYYFFVRNPRQN